MKLACQVFTVSEGCYWYEAKLNGDDAQIADRLLRLTDNNRSWSMGLSFLYLRNVNGLQWNHKHIYRELELTCV